MGARGSAELEIIWTSIAKLSLTLVGKNKSKIEKKLYKKGEYPDPIVKRVKKIDRESGGVYGLASLELRAMWAYSQLADEMCIRPLLKLDENDLMSLYDVDMAGTTLEQSVQRMEADANSLTLVRDKCRVLPTFGSLVLVDVGKSLKPTLKGGLSSGMSGASGIVAGKMVLTKLGSRCSTNVANVGKILPRFNNGLKVLRR